jgi:hypothetical protein
MKITETIYDLHPLSKRSFFTCSDNGLLKKERVVLEVLTFHGLNQ